MNPAAAGSTMPGVALLRPPAGNRCGALLRVSTHRWGLPSTGDPGKGVHTRHGAGGIAFGSQWSPAPHRHVAVPDPTVTKCPAAQAKQKSVPLPAAFAMEDGYPLERRRRR